jgi:hypothetical protein
MRVRILAAMCGLALLAFVAVKPAVAQDQTPPEQPQDQSQTQTPPEQTTPVKAKRKYPVSKFELSAGYAFRTFYAQQFLADGSLGSGTLHMNGVYGSLDYNKYRWLGIVGEAVATFKNQSSISDNGGLNGNTGVYTFLVGPQVYPFGHRKLTPFGHFLYGAGWYRNSTNAFSGFGGGVNNNLVRAWEAGGGLDFNFKEKWAARLIEFDTTSANFYTNTNNFANRGLTRISFGIVYHFGER